MKTQKYIAGGLALGAFLAARQAIRSARFMSIYKRVILITGGSRGLGLVLTRKLIKEGAKVAICARDENELSRVAQELQSPNLLTITCDITDKNQVKSMMSTIQQALGDVEMVINNAGSIQVGPMESMTESDYENAMKIHFWGAYNVINEALPSMKRRRAGRIVNIISINGKISFPHLLPYTVSKYALSGYSEGLTAELAKYNIYVTSVYPGLMRTGSPINVDVKGQHQKEYAWFKIMDSLPFISLNAKKAANKIIKAMKTGNRVLFIGIPTKVIIGMHGLFPNLNLAFFNLSNRLLPKVDENATETKKGYESKSWASDSFLTKSTNLAEIRNNERLN